MPKLAILISQDAEYLWWKYTLHIDGKNIVKPEHYATPQAAMAAALMEANRSGLYQ